MVKILYSDEIAQRLNVSKGTLHKREFQRRIGLPSNRLGKQIAIPEPVWDEWVLNPFRAKSDEQE
jgi:hypothetical protein